MASHTPLIDRDPEPEKVALLGDEESHIPPPETRRRMSRIQAAFLLTGSLLILAALTVHDANFLPSLSFPGCSKGHRNDTTHRHGHQDVCLTPACVHASSELLYNLSPDYKNIDPCTDFEELVCGGWRDRHDLRPDQGDAFTGTIMSESSQMLLRHILEAPYPKSASHQESSSASVDEENFDKLKAAYDACLDEDTIKQVGVAPLMEILNDTSSRFAVARKDALSDAVLHLANLGVSALVSAGTGADDRDPDTVIVSVSAPYRIGLPAKELYQDDKIVKRYTEVASQVISALYPHADLKVDSQALVDFEKKLAAASPDAEDRDDVTVSTEHSWFGQQKFLTKSRSTTIPCRWRKQMLSSRSFKSPKSSRAPFPAVTSWIELSSWRQTISSLSASFWTKRPRRPSTRIYCGKLFNPSLGTLRRMPSRPISASGMNCKERYA